MAHTKTSKLRINVYRLDWNLLRTFLVIMQERSISGAAARLFLTQPAVSQALKRLEENLGARLIERSGNVFLPTQIGEGVCRIAEEMFGHAAQIEGALEARSEEIVGKVRLLSASRIESSAYDRILEAFHRAHPRVDLQIDVMKSSEIIYALQQKSATVGIGLCRNRVEKIERRHFFRQRYAMYCGRHHRLFGCPTPHLSDLKAEDFVSFTSDQLGDSLSPLTVFRDQQGFTGRIVATSSSLDEIRRLIFLGYGIGSLPEHIVADDLACGRLWRLPPDKGVADVDIYWLWHSERRLSRADRAFFAVVERHMACEGGEDAVPAENACGWARGEVRAGR